MRRTSSVQSLVAIMFVCITISGCLSLAMQREMIEDMREEPVLIEKEDRFGWDYTFDTQDIESTEYINESEFLIDPTVSQIEIFFDASIGDAISDFANETFPGLVEEVGARYVEISVWEPGEYPSGTPFFTERATENYEFTGTYLNEDSSPFEDGEWILTVEARGIGIETPIDILSVFDSFTVYVTVIRPCVHFDEIHEDGECTNLIDLE